MNLKNLIQTSHENATQKQFWTTNPSLFCDRIMHITSFLARAVEDQRQNDESGALQNVCIAKEMMKSPLLHRADLPSAHPINGRLMLIITELAEAYEAYSRGDREGFLEELADTFIRLCDLSGRIGADQVISAIEQKQEINNSRPDLHGKSY